MSDRVELTAAEREALAEAGGTTIECRCEFCLNTEAAAESIVAARVAALIAERDDWHESATHRLSEGMRFRAERDAARAELAAANARCAELEAAVEQEITTRDQYADLLDRFAAAIPGDHGEHSSSNDPWTNALASAAALQETLDRVTALADEWEAKAGEGIYSQERERAAALRAALTPEGKE